MIPDNPKRLSESVAAATGDRSRSAETNRVLQLDGTNSFVELPANLLPGARELTFEAWLKWDAFGRYPPAFVLADRSRALVLVIGDLRNEAFGIVSEGAPILPSFVTPPGPLELHQWRHLAGVVSTNGLRLYLNGSLVMTNAYTERLFTNGPVQQAFLGSGQSDQIDFFRGEMDEVRLWRTARTPEQIRENIGRRLSGSEEGLIGLWNFDDPANPGRDASPGAHHGKFMGQASVTNAAPPVIVSGRFTDVSGKPLTNASVEIHQAGQPDRRVPANAAGEYAFTMASATCCDLFVNTGELSAYRLGWQASGESSQRLDWVLTGAGASAPAVGSRRGNETPSSIPQSNQSLVASPVTNRVLSLDGTNSYVELPDDAFTNLTTATIEGWVNWVSFNRGSRFFDFAVAGQTFSVQNRGRSPDLWLERDQADGSDFVQLPGVLSTGRWTHVAAVVGPETLKLFLDGLQVTTNIVRSSGSFAGVEKRNYLGRSNWRIAAARANMAVDEDFRGQMDEIRVWQGERTVGQIRENMGNHLTGHEPGLVGLWNFDDPANPGRDASPGGNHGKLMGQASVTNATLPVIVSGRITDVSGNPLAGASVEVRRLNGTEYRFTANNAGEYAFAMAPADRCDLFVNTGELSAYRLGFQPIGEPPHRLDWVLTETGVASSSRREESPTSNSALRTPSSALNQSLLTSAATSLGAGTVVAVVLTDERGDFAFTNVPPGA